MVQSLKVILWGEEIGRLAWDTRRRLSCFMYNPAFLKKGLNISPLASPVDGSRGLNLYGEKRLRFIKKIQINFLNFFYLFQLNQIFYQLHQELNLPMHLE